ncbi:hypothetical protein LEN26_019029 [Aphanomyces euteiches]|nr:hypothetical protein LEN26_019029 [Aphanomyces euteiches]KAH9110582.1 hypothetical protein AeMF1_014672 [Aphanomyces euteiches]KAH9193023.1 hypothetical protein AeNC1_004995 [Aphanomyces euteiches]
MATEDNVVMTEQLLQYLRETTVPSPSVWQERTLFIKEWLLLNNSLQNIPDDGTEDLIHRQIRRGDLYPETRGRCWMHLVCELREIPVVKLACDAPEPENVSPSRGKLRPGKELVVLPVTDNDSVVPTLQISDDNTASGEPTSARGDGSQRNLNRPASIAKEKSFSSMSMMERQAEWLRKKQEKVEAEEKRQREEKEKELTFKPNLINRRQTMTDKPEDKPKPALPVKQNSFNEKKLENVTKGGSFKESRPTQADTPEKRPVSRSTVEKPSKPKTGKPPLKKKKSTGKSGVDTKLEVTSHLLNSMKSELKASKAMTLDNDQQDDDTNGDEVDDDGDDDDDQDAEGGIDDVPLLPGIASCDYKIDFSGMETKARLVLQDAALFELNSMYRKTDKGAGREGIALQMGRREDNHEEQVVAVIFDKEKISEADAQKWWQEHKSRFFDMPNNVA